MEKKSSSNIQKGIQEINNAIDCIRNALGCIDIESQFQGSDSKFPDYIRRGLVKAVTILDAMNNYLPKNGNFKATCPQEEEKWINWRVNNIEEKLYKKGALVGQIAKEYLKFSLLDEVDPRVTMVILDEIVRRICIHMDNDYPNHIKEEDKNIYALKSRLLPCGDIEITHILVNPVKHGVSSEFLKVHGCVRTFPEKVVVRKIVLSIIHTLGMLYPNYYTTFKRVNLG